MMSSTPSELGSPKLVLFDVGSTLVDPHPSAQDLIVQVCQAHGLPLERADLDRALPGARRAVTHLTPFQRYGLDESRAYWDAFYTALLTELGYEAPAGLRSRLFEVFQQMENWRLYPDALPVLQELRQRGCRIGVVSNWEEWLEDFLLTLEVHHLFDFILASGTFGRAKPHRSIFERALALGDAAPAEAVHVGDSPREDIEGARAVGIRAIMIDRHGRHPTYEGERIASLGGLPPLLF